MAVLGAFLAGYFLSPIFEVGTINNAITIPTMLVTLLGAVILLAIVNLIRRRQLPTFSTQGSDTQGCITPPLPTIDY